MKFIYVVVFIGSVLVIVGCGEKSMINVKLLLDFVFIGVFVDSLVSGFSYNFVFVEVG